jgi:hypothetical protein
MKSFALLAACAVPVGVLLVGCGDGGSGCDVRTQACDHSPGPSGGVSGTGQPYESYEDKQNSDYLNDRANSWDEQQRQHEESLRQDGYQQGYDEGYQDGQDSVPRSDDEGSNADRSRLGQEWYYNVPPEILDRGPGPG